MVPPWALRSKSVDHRSANIGDSADSSNLTVITAPRIICLQPNKTGLSTITFDIDLIADLGRCLLTIPPELTTDTNDIWRRWAGSSPHPRDPGNSRFFFWCRHSIQIAIFSFIYASWLPRCYTVPTGTVAMVTASAPCNTFCDCRESLQPRRYSLDLWHKCYIPVRSRQQGISAGKCR